MPPTIPTPLRILLLSTPNTSIPTLFQDTETHQILTPYYSASIPLWRDTLPTSLPAWSSEWQNPEAAEVIEAIGAWIVCFRAPATKDELENIRTTLQTVHDVIAHHTTSSYNAPDPLLVALAMPNPMTPGLGMGEEEWEDLGRECGGWEYIDGGIALSGGGDGSTGGGGGGGEKGKGEGRTNEYGEKVGMDRLVEALEANEWESGVGGGVDEFDDDDDDGGGEGMEGVCGEEQGLEGELGFVGGEAQEDTEMGKGLLNREEVDTGGDEDVMALESVMLKMQAVKEMGADMPEAERKRFAAKAVREAMKKI